MTRLTDEGLIRLFDERTYERGLEYYKNGHVLKPSRLKTTLFAKVIGSRLKPYEVQAELDGKDIFTSCTCPVGDMCKHGVALLLKWIREPYTFIDRGKIIQSLEKKSKAELLNIMQKAIDEHPFLIDELELRREDRRDTSHIDAKKYLRKIEDIVSEFDIYDVSILEMLEDVRDTADDLRDDGRYMDAARIYLELVAAGLKIFGNHFDSDEMDRSAEHFVQFSIKRFNEDAPQIMPESAKNDLFDKILDIVRNDEFNLGADYLFFGVTTKHNISQLEKLMRDRVSGEDKENDDGYSYCVEGANEIMSLIYEHLDTPERKII